MGPQVEVMRGHRGDVLKVLVVTVGGAPTPSQQLKLTRLRIHRGMTIAVVSASVGVRFVASSMALLTRQIRTFVPQDFASACAFLELTQAQVQSATRFSRRTDESEPHVSGRAASVLVAVVVGRCFR